MRKGDTRITLIAKISLLRLSAMRLNKRNIKTAHITVRLKCRLFLFEFVELVAEFVRRCPVLVLPCRETLFGNLFHFVGRFYGRRGANVRHMQVEPEHCVKNFRRVVNFSAGGELCHCPQFAERERVVEIVVHGGNDGGFLLRYFLRSVVIGVRRGFARAYKSAQPVVSGRRSRQPVESEIEFVAIVRV